MRATRLALIACLALAGIVGPWIAWIGFQQIAFSACRFGCAGGLAFAATYSGAAGLVAAVAALIAFALVGRRHERAIALGPRTLVTALLLSVLLATVPHWPLSDALLVAAWFALAVVAFAAAYAVRPRRNPETASPLR